MKKYPQRLLAIAKSPNVRFLAVSNAIKQRAIAFGIPSEKITVHYIGVDTSKFKPSGLPIQDRDNIVLFIGRFVEKKAPLLLIRSFVKVVKQIPDAKLVMVGDGELKAEAEQLAEQFNLPVAFKGALTSKQILNELDKAKVFCLPSVTAKNGDAEGLPISILEAASKNLFIVTTKHSGNDELPCFSMFGKAVSEHSSPQLSLALTEMLSRKNKINIFDIDEFFLNFDIKECCEGLEKIYSEINTK